jgi:hypothetical protein
MIFKIPLAISRFGAQTAFYCSPPFLSLYSLFSHFFLTPMISANKDMWIIRYNLAGRKKE